MFPEEVTPGVLVFTSATMSTTSTAVVHEGAAVLIDPAWQPAELAGIADELDRRGLRVEFGWSTHAHHDHLLWHERFGSAPRLATPRAAAAAREHLSQIRSELEPRLRPLAGLVSGYDGARLPWRGPVADVIGHDGHSVGHGALWLPERRVLVAGDMLSDVEIPLLAETGLAAYRDGLQRLAPYVEQAEVLIPGHGRPAVAAAVGISDVPVADVDSSATDADSPVARLAADLTYLEALRTGEQVADSRLRHGPDWLGSEHEANRAVAR